MISTSNSPLKTPERASFSSQTRVA